MITGGFRGHIGSLFSDPGLKRIRNERRERALSGAIASVKNTDVYKAVKEIKKIELELEDKMNPLGRLLIRGISNIPGMAETIYRKRQTEKGKPYVPITTPALDYHSTLRLLDIIEPEWRERNENYSWKDAAKNLIIGGLIAGSPYSVPFLQRAIGNTTNSQESGMSNAKKWALGLGAAALAFFGAVAAFDFDNDGVSTWNEWFKYKTNPFSKDYALKYAIENGITDPETIRKLLPLEEMGTEYSRNLMNVLLKDGLDVNEEKLIEDIGHIKSGLIPKEIRDKYYPR